MTALAFTTITGTFEDAQGNPLTGTASFTPNVTTYASAVPVLTAGVAITGQIVAGQLVAESGGPFRLLATDNAGLAFEGLTGFLIYTVTVTAGGVTQDPWSFSLPSSPGTVDLYELGNTGAGGGTVTDVSVVTANGLAGTVATATTTPAITLETTVTGLLKGNGTAISAATAGTDYLTPSGSGAALTGITASQVGALPSTDDLSAIAAANATAGNVAMNGHKLTGLANGSASTDAAAFGQIPASLPPNGPASGDLSGSYPGPAVARVNGGSLPVSKAIVGTNSSGQLVDATSAALTNSTSGNAATATNLAGGAALPAYLAPKVTVLTDASSVPVNAALGNDFRLTFTSAVGTARTIAAPSNATDGQSATFELIQAGSGGPYTVTWTSGAGGYDFGTTGAPTLSASGGATDLVAFRYSSAKGQWLALGSALGF